MVQCYLYGQYIFCCWMWQGGMEDDMTDSHKGTRKFHSAGQFLWCWCMAVKFSASVQLLINASVRQYASDSKPYFHSPSLP